MNRIVEEWLRLLPVEHKDEWEERAAIMEFDGGLSREHAECLAMLCILKRHQAALLPSYVKEHSIEKEIINE